MKSSDFSLARQTAKAEWEDNIIYWKGSFIMEGMNFPSGM